MTHGKSAPVSRECVWFRVCPMKRFYEAEKLDRHWIDDYCHGDWRSCMRFRKEERGEYHPDEMLPDGSVDDSLRRLFL